MFSFVAISALVVAVCADPISHKTIFPNGRIVGGENAIIETYPYQVSLQYFGRHTCGASIISANFIVTAGHCADAPASQLTVRAGSSVRGKFGSIHHVEKVLRHDKYFTTRYGVPVNDVAVMRVKEPFEFDNTRQPIALFEIDEEATPGVQSVITGWGNTGSFVSTDQLQTVSIPIVSKSQCDNAYRQFGGLPAGQICAAYYGQGGKDACQGDSGGPLAINGRLAGIVSWGNGCAKPNYPGVYTEVSQFREWINNNAEL